MPGLIRKQCPPIAIDAAVPHHWQVYKDCSHRRPEVAGQLKGDLNASHVLCESVMAKLLSVRALVWESLSGRTDPKPKPRILSPKLQALQLTF